MDIRKEKNEKILCLLTKLSLEEKIGIIHGDGLFQSKGVERLGIPPLRMSDGPMGVRQEFAKDAWEPVGNTEDYVIYLPSNSAIASSWNREIAHKVGVVLGREARGRGKDVILAPGINIKRSPLCGRNFEYMSEDPCLTAGQCVPLIQGIQENDVAACVKHFALNNQERNRLWVNVEVSERALREIYLPAFWAALKKANAFTLMGAYNLVRGSRCCENEYLLDEILRKEWDWDGVTISDWGGILRTKESAQVSMDMEMSVYTNFDEYFFAASLLEAVKNGEVSEEKIDEKVYHILDLMLKLHMLDGERQAGCYNHPSHRSIALEAARESIVLLKNEEERLPLKIGKRDRILVIGCNADSQHSNGGGSAEIKALYEISPLMGLKSQLGGDVEVKFVKGYYVPDQLGQGSRWQEDSLKDREGKTAEEEVITEEIAAKRKELLEEAVALAKQYQNVIYVGGLNYQYDLEDQDRRSMKLPYGQDDLIEAILKVNPETVIVMNAGSPVEMYRWEKNAKAIVWYWYAGMEGGNALAEVLLGRTNPSGRLPESFPVTHMDCSAHCVGEFGKKDEVVYREGIYVGYRYYDKNAVPVQYPFGHGLSYTSFSYGKCDIVLNRTGGCIEEMGSAAYDVEQLMDLRIQVCISIRNTGNRQGKEVVQLYVKSPGRLIDRPLKELKGYEKLDLAPGEEKDVIFCLTGEDFVYYDEKNGRMMIEPGEYEIMLGASLADIRSTAKFVL